IESGRREAKLADKPSVSQLIVQDDRVAVDPRAARRPERTKQRAKRSCRGQWVTGLVPNPERDVDRFHKMIRPYFAVCIRRHKALSHADRIGFGCAFKTHGGSIRGLL